MLNPFPIQFLAMLAYFLLRVLVGSILIYLGYTHILKRQDLKHSLTLSWFPYGIVTVWYLALVELTLGIMFVVGFYTQIAALIVFFMAVKLIIFNKKFASPYLPGKIFYILLIAVSLSLFITGAGAFAFDLPI